MAIMVIAVMAKVVIDGALYFRDIQQMALESRIMRIR